jgi:AcrR family transcriptional regulator
VPAKQSERRATKARPSSAFRNDKLIVEAATELLSEGGFESVTLNKVAVKAGLSFTALRGRFDSLEELLIYVWDEIGIPHFLKPLDACVDYYISGQAVKSDVLDTYLKNFDQLSDHSKAALELLLGSVTHSELRTRIQESSAPYFSTIAGRKLDYLARYVFFASTIVGVLALSRVLKIPRKSIIRSMHEVGLALATPGAKISIPVVNAKHLQDYALKIEDDFERNVFTAMLDCVSEKGFAKTTTKDIALAAAMSEGRIFGKFSSKLEIFLKAMEAQTDAAFDSNLEAMRIWLEKYGLSVANAILIREYLKPEVDRQRALQLEAMRLSWHVPEIRAQRQSDLKQVLKKQLENGLSAAADEVESEIILQQAIPMGLLIVALFNDSSYKLPHTVATSQIFI